MANIRWGVDLGTFHPGIDSEYLREELNLGHSPIFLALASLTLFTT